MAAVRSFGDVIKELRERKKLEKENLERLKEISCSRCGRSIYVNGVSRIFGLCNNCITSSLL